MFILNRLLLLSKVIICEGGVTPEIGETTEVNIVARCVNCTDQKFAFV